MFWTRPLAPFNVGFMFAASYSETNGWEAGCSPLSWRVALKGAGEPRQQVWGNKDDGHYLFNTCHNWQMSNDLLWQVRSASPTLQLPAVKRMNCALYSRLVSESHIRQHAFFFSFQGCCFGFAPFEIHPTRTQNRSCYFYNEAVPIQIHTMRAYLMLHNSDNASRTISGKKISFWPAVRNKWPCAGIFSSLKGKWVTSIGGA